MANYKLKYAGEKIDELLTKIDNLGAGTDTKSGTVKLSSATDSDSGVSDGVAATPAAVKAAYDVALSAKEVAEEATSKNYTITVPASGWADGALTFQGISCTKYNTVAVAGVTADTRLSLGRYVSGDLEACRSYICQDTGAGTVTFWATGALAEVTVELVELK